MLGFILEKKVKEQQEAREKIYARSNSSAKLV